MGYRSVREIVCDGCGKTEVAKVASDTLNMIGSEFRTVAFGNMAFTDEDPSKSELRSIASASNTVEIWCANCIKEVSILFKKLKRNKGFSALVTRSTSQGDTETPTDTQKSVSQPLRAGKCQCGLTFLGGEAHDKHVGICPVGGCGCDATGKEKDRPDADVLHGTLYAHSSTSGWYLKCGFCGCYVPTGENDLNVSRLEDHQGQCVKTEKTDQSGSMPPTLKTEDGQWVEAGHPEPHHGGRVSTGSWVCLCFCDRCLVGDEEKNRNWCICPDCDQGGCSGHRPEVKTKPLTTQLGCEVCGDPKTIGLPRYCEKHAKLNAWKPAHDHKPSELCSDQCPLKDCVECKGQGEVTGCFSSSWCKACAGTGKSLLPCFYCDEPVEYRSTNAHHRWVHVETNTPHCGPYGDNIAKPRTGR